MRKSRIAFILFCLTALLPTTAFAIYNGTLETGYPSVGAVVINYTGGSEAMCTGTLVGDSWVVTAAHGYESGCSAVFLLGSDASDPDATITVAGWTIHPSFDPGTLANDIALLHLATPVSAATPMMVSTESPSTLIGDDVVVVGFGQVDYTDVGGLKRRCTIPVTAYSPSHIFDTDCPGIGPYYGDGGAPAIVFDSGSPRLAGICSAVLFDGDAPQTAFFTATADFASYIASVMGSTSNTAPPQPQLVSPTDGQTGLGTTVTFTWYECLDPDGDPVDYRLIVDDDAAFGSPIIVDVEGTGGASGAIAGVAMCAVPLLLLAGTTAASRRAKALLMILLLGLLAACPNPPDAGGPISRAVSGLQAGTTYHWKVEAVDALGGASESEVRSFATM